MNVLKKAIFTAASPNTQWNDALKAFLLLISPWNWDNKSDTLAFKKELENYLNIEYVSLVDSGRSALYTALKALGIEKGDEVILPSFTCVVVANAVSWTNATPIYLDSNKADYNAKYSNIEEHISEKTKAIIVQHTFGKKVDVLKIKTLLKKRGREDIKIIEDFAHIIKRDIDLKGDAGFLTFGIEKVISTVRGGAVITHKSEVYKSIEEQIATYSVFPRRRIAISLANPVFWWIAIPLHSVGIGRATLGALIRVIWRRLGMLGIMVEERENKGLKPDWIPARMAGSLASLGILQLKKLDMYNDHRKAIATIYHDSLGDYSDADYFDPERVYLRYPILLASPEDAEKVWNISRSQRVTLGNWFSKPLYGNSVNKETYRRLCFVPATTPETLYKTERVLNLPTSINISKERAIELVNAIEKAIA